MKIAELTGIKQHPAFQAAQKIDDKNPQKTDKGKNLTAELARLGWTPTSRGGGTYSMVYQHPNKPYVLKVFIDGVGLGPEIYKKWLNYVMNNQQNPHVPKLYGKPRKISDTAWAIRMELLQSINVNDPKWKKYIDPDIDKNPEYQNLVSKWTYTLFDQIFMWENKPWLEENWPDLYKALRFAYSIGSDIHESENIMSRGDIIVLIDP